MYISYTGNKLPVPWNIDNKIFLSSWAVIMQLISDYEKTLIILFSILPYKSLTQTPFWVYALNLTYLNPAKLPVLELLFAQCNNASRLIRLIFHIYFDVCFLFCHSNTSYFFSYR